MNEIDFKINELMKLIDDQEEVRRYKEIEKELHHNEFIKNKIEEFKVLQKRMAIYESHQNTIPVEVNQRYESLLNDLLDIPIFNEYLTLQEEINELLQSITNIIEQSLNKNEDVQS